MYCAQTVIVKTKSLRPKTETQILDRRTFLESFLISVAAQLGSSSLRANTPLRLVLVHGRRQQGLDPAELRSKWLRALNRGAQKLGRSIPDDIDVAFPYYGDVLDKLAREYDIPLSSHIQARGNSADKI